MERTWNEKLRSSNELLFEFSTWSFSMVLKAPMNQSFNLLRDFLIQLPTSKWGLKFITGHLPTTGISSPGGNVTFRGCPLLSQPPELISFPKLHSPQGPPPTPKFPKPLLAALFPDVPLFWRCSGWWGGARRRLQYLHQNCLFCEKETVASRTQAQQLPVTMFMKMKTPGTEGLEVTALFVSGGPLSSMV